MTEDGYYEPDVCIICGQKCYVGKNHKALLGHVISTHLCRRVGYYEEFKCWCQYRNQDQILQKSWRAVGRYDASPDFMNHLGQFVDLNMTFPTSVDALWAHYHASMIGVTPEVKCDTSIARP
jgi:hypothetical protein